MELKKLLEGFLNNFDAHEINNYFGSQFGDDWDNYLKDGISISWNDKKIYIDPFSKNNIKVYYDNKEYKYKNVDDLLNDEIYDNKSLKEISNVLTID